MAHRKSQARIAKAKRIARLQNLSTTRLAAQRDGVCAPTGAEWATLEAQLSGHVILPGDPSYDTDRQEANPAFQYRPIAIVYCASEDDVVTSLAFAAETRIAFTVRSGGHSTAGYSVCNGLVIDISLMNDVVIDASNARIIAGAGANWDKFNGTLGRSGWHVPTGACGSVCVAGFVQGGGYGYTSRKYGIQSDCVESFRIALAPGHPLGLVAIASAEVNPDLFWALRGGTGGNFGVVTQVVYRAVQLPSVWAWAISWDAAHAAQALALMQAEFTLSGCPDELGYMMNIGCFKGQPVYMAQGMYAGSRDAGMAAIASLLALPSARLLVDQVGSYPAMDAYLEDNPFPLPDQPEGTPEGKRSCYIAQPMAQADWQRVVDYMATSPNPWSLAYTEPYGGAINRVPAADSAFVHRSAAFDFVVDVFWRDEAEQARMLAWVDGLMALVAPFANGEVYQNYPQADLANWPQAYFGAAYPRLQQVKAKYDPTNFFRYAQSIEPAAVNRA